MFTQTIGARRAQVQSKHYGVEITNRRRINVGVKDALVGAGAMLTSDMKCSMPTVSGVKRALWNCLGVYLRKFEVISTTKRSKFNAVVFRNFAFLVH